MLNPSKLMGARRLARVLRWLADERGNVGPILALMVVPIIGAFAIGGETSSWYMYHRSQQNAADSAVIAAALKKDTAEGQSIATKFGYTNGSNNVTVTALSGQTCPAGAAVLGGTNSCYKVTVLRTVPIYLSKVVGYNGDRALGAGRGKDISASAMAGLVAGTNPFCMVGLNSLKLGGGNGTDLTGCSLLSGSGGMQCSGTNSANGVTNAYTTGTIQGNASNCAPNTTEHYTGFSGDPLSTQVNNALSNMSCTFSASITLASGVNNCKLGQLTLTSDWTVTSPNTVLAIQTDASGSGGLNLNGHTISTSGSGTLTIVFTGTTQINANILTGSGGTLNIGAPTAANNSPWEGIAIAEAPSMPNNSHQGQTYYLDMDFAGGSNNITLDISGMIYAPNATVNINGAIDHASNGYRCIGIVANVINTTGTNDIFSNPTSECRQYGDPLPTVPMIALVQ